MLIKKIIWLTWAPTDAQGSAIFSEKVCKPNCAEGYRVDVPVNLKLNSQAMAGKKIYLTNLEMSASTKQNFTNGNRTLTWDLGEFAKLMESE
jgi:hypothetical protein